MSKTTRGRRANVVQALKAEILRGTLRNGEQLAGEPVDHLPADADGPGGCIRRRRRVGQHTPVSYEVATVPALGPLADLPDTGLVDGSLTASLEAAGLRGVSGEQQVSLERLDADAAALLGRDPGTPFLRTERTTVNAGGDFVEHVVSLLDPDHFRLTLTFGDPA